MKSVTFSSATKTRPAQEFEEALVGINAGEERKVQFAYREDLPNEELAGKTEHFEVKAREVRERTLPDLDDEFAKDLGEQFETLEDLRNNIKEQVAGRWDYMGQQRERSELIGQLIEKNAFELPDSMVENYLQSMRQQDQNQNHDQDSDRGHEPSEEERENAVRRLKSYLLTEAVRKKADISVSDEEFEAHLEERANAAGVKAEEVRRSGRADDLRRELEENKVFELLGEKANVTEEKV